MQIMIKNFKAKVLSLEVKPEDTVLHLKQVLQEKEGIVVESIRLVFGGRLLNNSSTLSDYNLQQGSVLHMVLQLR